jgi:hypothetical protein
MCVAWQKTVSLSISHTSVVYISSMKWLMYDILRVEPVAVKQSLRKR